MSIESLKARAKVVACICGEDSIILEEQERIISDKN